MSDDDSEDIDFEEDVCENCREKYKTLPGVLWTRCQLVKSGKRKGGDRLSQRLLTG